MVPISLEVTKLLLESMHRLDQGRQGEEAGIDRWGQAEMAREPAPERLAGRHPGDRGPCPGRGPGPESPPPAAASAGIDPAEDLPSADLLPPYAVMAQTPGSVRRLAPYALVVTLSFLVGGFYLANIEASAQAVDVGPGGEPILSSPAPAARRRGPPWCRPPPMR